MPGAQRTTPVTSRDVDPQLLLDPLGYLRTEIYRQRVACNTLEAMANSGANGDVQTDAERMVRYLVKELPLHIADLEESLLPLLEQRTLPADGFDTVLAQDRSKLRCSDENLNRLINSLRQIADGAAPPADLRSDAGAIVERRRRELSWENDVILPLAEKRITGADLATLGTAMAHRRGTPHPT